jgi:hypothetical protein
MKTVEKVFGVAIFLVASTALHGASDEQFRLAITNVVACVDQDDLYTFTIGEIGGQHICRHPAYQSLAAMVSNDWRNVIESIGTIATNQTERCLLLGVGFQYGWDFHLPFFTKVADECLAGNISSNEVSWFEAYSTKPGLVDQLYYRNTEPAVTNLLHKMVQITGATNVWTSIMSTNAHQKVQEYIDAGILYIPE